MINFSFLCPADSVCVSVSWEVFRTLFSPHSAPKTGDLNVVLSRVEKVTYTVQSSFPFNMCRSKIKENMIFQCVFKHILYFTSQISLWNFRTNICAWRYIPLTKIFKLFPLSFTNPNSTIDWGQKPKLLFIAVLRNTKCKWRVRFTCFQRNELHLTAILITNTKEVANSSIK